MRAQLRRLYPGAVLPHPRPWDAPLTADVRAARILNPVRLQWECAPAQGEAVGSGHLSFTVGDTAPERVAPLFWRYWGKADPQVGGLHLAAFHCLDVAAVAERLLQRHAVLRSRLAGMLRLSAPDVAPFVALLAALHDFGKFDVRFQLKAPETAATLHPRRSGVVVGPYDHGAAGYHQLRSLDDVVQRRLGPKVRPLLQAVCGHHGELPSNAQPPSSTLAFRALALEDQQARRQWLEAVLDLFASRRAPLPWTQAPTLATVELLAGLCSVCDWLGSQAEYFPYRALPESLEGYYSTALSQADTVLDAVGLADAQARAQTFEALFPGRSPRDVQRVTESLELPVGPCLVVVEAQMGSGKTEAALSLASRMLARGDASGAYVALPTMATSNGMFRRVADVAPRLFQGRVNLMLAHGRSAANEVFRQLIARPLRHSSPEDAEASVVCARWYLSRKRSLLGQLGVGTVDQAMQAAIQVRHHFVRAFGLATSVVVIDEVHAYDAYMEVILERLVEWLGALGAPVILLSATLPAHRRQVLVDCYLRGLGAPHHPLLSAGDQASYPLVTVASGQGVSQVGSDSIAHARSIRVELLSTDAPEEVVLTRLAELVARGAMVGWIRNTVSEAQAAYDVAMSLGLSATLFHARMRGRDRQAIEDEVLRTYGPTGERKGGLLIATQVVEQSLDLDFDLLVTDLAPIDLVLQRCGRLHRHARDQRPEGTEQTTLIVCAPSPGQVDALGFGPSKYVYDPVSLWLSFDSLAQQRTLELPADLRPLVEDSYAPERRTQRLASASNADALQNAEDELKRALEVRRGNAQRACIPPAASPPGAFACLGDDDEVVQALTRDGQSVTLLPVLWDGEEGRSLDGERWCLDGEDVQRAWSTAEALHEETLRVPAYPWEHLERGARARGEAAAWDAWLTRFTRFAEGMGLGDVVVVPMRERSGAFFGRVESNRRTRRLGYSRQRGLWFRSEDE